MLVWTGYVWAWAVAPSASPKKVGISRRRVTATENTPLAPHRPWGLTLVPWIHAEWLALPGSFLGWWVQG